MKPKPQSLFSYRELRQMWETAMRMRRGQTKSGRKYPLGEIDAAIRRMAGAGSNITSMKALTRQMMAAQNQADTEIGIQPPEQGERNIQELTALANGMGLNIPRALSGDTREVLDRFAMQRPKSAFVANTMGSLPSFALGGAAAGPNLLRQGMMGAGMSGAMTAGDVLPDTSMTGADKAQSMLLSGGIGFGTGVLGAALPRIGAEKFGRTGPAADMGEQLLARAGGQEGLERAAGRMRTPAVPPTLAELSPEFAGAVQQTGAMNRSARAQLAADARATLQQVTEAKQAISQRYAALNRPLDTAAVRRIVARQDVQDVLNDLRRAGVGPPDVLDGRTLNDVRMILRDEAFALRRKGGAAGNRLANSLSDASKQLEKQLTDHIPGFTEIQAEIAPYIRRELRLRRALRTLGGTGSEVDETTLLAGRGGRIPVGRSGLMHEIGKSMGTLPYQRQHAAGRELAPLLMRPAPADALAGQLHDLWPWYTNPAGAGLLTGGVAQARRRKRFRPSLLAP